jgi:sodium transport system permease protein
MTQMGLVFRKEMLDILRDRRTLMSMIVVPLVVMPLLIFGMGEMTLLLVEKAKDTKATVMVLGGENAPRLMERLRADEMIEIVKPTDNYVARIQAKHLRAAIEFPEGFESQVEAEASDLRVRIYYHEGDIHSEFAVRNLENVLRSFRDDIVESRLAARDVNKALLEPFDNLSKNVASKEAVSGAGFGGIVPYIIILLTLQGAMYPAIDLTAGEKERGTIETILASPVSRGSLATGKFMTVLVVAIGAALLALISLGISSHYFASSSRGELAASAGMSIALPPKGVLAMLVMIVPVAVMFSGLLLALALMAKSYKEAQSYTSPLIMAAILPAVASMLPGIEMSMKLAVIPILNVSLASKSLLAGHYEWNWIGIIFASSCVYAAVGLAIAAMAFRRESVLFRT